MPFGFRPVIVSLFVVLLAVACTARPPLLDDQLLQDTTILSDDECGAPCWHGITPGETTWAMALDTLGDLPNVLQVEVSTVRRGAGARFATFSSGQGAPCCELFSDDGQIVDRMLLRYAPTMRLGELIDRYGEPAYIGAAPYTNETAVGTLIFPEQGMVVAFYLDGLEAGAVSEETIILGTYLSTTASVETVIANSQLYVWDGYKPYADYAENPYDLQPNA